MPLAPRPLQDPRLNGFPPTCLAIASMYRDILPPLRLALLLQRSASLLFAPPLPSIRDDSADTASHLVRVQKPKLEKAKRVRESSPEICTGLFSRRVQAVV